MNAKIPTINLHGNELEIRAALVRSLAKTGFAVIINHGIPLESFVETYVDWEDFFKRPLYKMDYLFDKKTQFGFFPMRSEKAKGANISDLKEFYHFFGNQKQELPNLPYLAQHTVGVFTELEALAIKLLNTIERGTPTDWNKCDRPWSTAVQGSVNTLLRILHYPPLGPDVEPGAVRAAAHEDINFLTLLPSATEPGLQVKDNDGNWYDVPVDHPNSIIVNVGDMLQEASGGFYKSTTHRVINPTEVDVARYSMPLFLHASPNTRLSPRYTAQEYLMERLKEIGLI